MLTIVQGLPEGTVGAVAHGRVKRADYESVLIPALESALKRHDRVNFYYETGPDFSGFDPGAMLDDFSVGVRHLGHWQKIALVTDSDWLRHAASAFGFMVHGRMKVFPLAQAAAARTWVAEP